ncbi:hypothetical protein ACFVAF_04190 [Streptomyces sp. NPDC057596]|uniref:hypothetical protein n=1 Tax=Streptomyces sp. NPDC057596 TaxID=3346178 RepID=UPI00368D3250
MPPRKQITLLDIYEARGFKLTREQARKLVALLRLTDERPAPATTEKPAERPDAA